MIIIVYDDTVCKSEVIEDIIGDKGFADVVVKKQRLEEYYKAEVKNCFPDFMWKKIHTTFEYPALLKELEVYKGSDVKIMHCFSNYLISDVPKAALSFKKLMYVDEPFGVLSGKKAIGAMFPDISSYMAFCREIISGQNAAELAKNIKDTFEMEGLVDIGIISNFIQCITGNFDSRYFNTLKGNEYTLVKSSFNKKKIKAEYDFYHLLPEDMRYWFVMPFGYEENGEVASYSMERLHMADLAVKWVHGSISMAEFESLMDKYFFFLKKRHAKECTEAEYQKVADLLYIDKVSERTKELKNLPEYEKIKALSATYEKIDIDVLVDKYFELKAKIEKRNKYPKQLVIGHGDLCFANALYNKSTKTLKFIDPKGATKEEELWTNPYYDVAKLSHSVCGRYDFFNNALFEIKVDEDFTYKLEIPFDNLSYVEIFKRKLEENGFDYLTVRIYEASLFLSMLPLHIDNLHKVFGFILNAKNILEEIEKDV